MNPNHDDDSLVESYDGGDDEDEGEEEVVG